MIKRGVSPADFDQCSYQVTSGMNVSLTFLKLHAPLLLKVTYCFQKTEKARNVASIYFSVI